MKKRFYPGPEEIAWWLRVLNDLVEDLGPVLGSSHPGGLMPSSGFWTLWALYSCGAG